MLTNFGKQLRMLRIEKDKRLKDMADELGVTVAYLSAVENGNRTVPDSWVGIIAERYGLTEKEIISLQSAAYEKKNDIRIGIANAGSREKDLALSFARKFKTLSFEQVDELQKILDE